MLQRACGAYPKFTCDLPKFRELLRKELQGYSHGFVASQEEELFRSLDSNGNGLLNVNEIGNGLSPFYPNSDTMGSREGKYWSAISKTNWIPRNVMESQMGELGNYTKL